MSAQAGCGLLIGGFFVLLAFYVTAGVIGSIFGQDVHNPAWPSLVLAGVTWVAVGVGAYLLLGSILGRLPMRALVSYADRHQQVGPHACTAVSCWRKPADHYRCPVCGEAPGWRSWRPVGRSMQPDAVGPTAWISRERRYHNFACGKCGSVSTFVWRDFNKDLPPRTPGSFTAQWHYGEAVPVWTQPDLFSVPKF
jgi:predicted RNA-binding Zn-ribbon protein involved in translation (DUF1610 family)